MSPPIKTYYNSNILHELYEKNMVICDLIAFMEFQTWSFFLDPWLKQGIDLSCNYTNYYPFGLKYKDD